MFASSDDYFCHQLVEPHATVLLNDPTWAERAYFTVADPDRFALDLGIALLPNADALEAYALATVPDGPQWSLRAARDLADGRWPLAVGPVRLEPVDPLRRWLLRCEPNASGIAFELEFEARCVPYETSSPTIRRRNRLVYQNVNMLQTGRYRGTVTIDGRRFAVDGIPGHRDRTWGIRTLGEGHVPRGLFAWLSAELPDVALTAIVHERQDGTVLRCDGAVSYEGGRQVPVAAVEHELRFDHDSRQLERATFVLRDAERLTWTVQAEPALRLYLAGAGYTAGPRPRGKLGAPFWSERWDVRDPAVRARVDELNDSICRMRCGERTGHGVIETALGAHDRYRVAPRPPLDAAAA